MLIYPTYIHMCVFISMCMYVICHKQCVLWKMLWERRLSAYWRISRANILLIGWPVSQRPFFRRRQNQQDGPLTYFLSGDILMGTFRYVPPEPNQCASFANSRAEISCHLSSAGNGFTLIHLYFLNCQPHHPPTNNRGHLFLACNLCP